MHTKATWTPVWSEDQQIGAGAAPQMLAKGLGRSAQSWVPGPKPEGGKSCAAQVAWGCPGMRKI